MWSQTKNPSQPCSSALAASLASRFGPTSSPNGATKFRRFPPTACTLAGPVAGHAIGRGVIHPSVTAPRASHAVRPATTSDAAAMARIYNQGIAERIATFETRTQAPDELIELIEGGAGEVVGFAKVPPSAAPSHYYSGVGEATLYVDRRARRSGAARALMEAVAREAERRGYHKLTGKIFTSNRPSIALVHSCGWREVGIHRRHGRLDGEWRGGVVVERLLGEASD